MGLLRLLDGFTWKCVSILKGHTHEITAMMTLPHNALISGFALNSLSSAFHC